MANYLNRRRLLASSAGLAALPLASCAPAVTKKADIQLDLNDPAERARIRAAIVGSTAAETIHSLYRLHIYAYTHDGNPVPFCSMYNLNIIQWQPTDDGKYKAKSYEAGIYTNFDAEEIIDVWDNPITGEQREVWQFIGGPIEITVGPDGVETGASATVHPDSMAITTLGDTVFLPTQSGFSFPNPFKPEKWPNESAGGKYYWGSYYTFSAQLEDVANRDLSSVPSHAQFQNLVTWHPWLGMGQYPGRTFGRAFGTKLPNGLNDVPEKILAGFEKHTPEILDIDNWSGRRNDFIDYMKTRKPT
jgi:hypothetical protein